MIKLAAILVLLPGLASAQALLNSFSTISMQRCLAAVEQGRPARGGTMFTGEPKAGLLPEDMFNPITFWVTNDDRIYLTVDAKGNCAVGDTLAAQDTDAHDTARRRFDAWGAEEVKAGRYIDANLAEETLSYRRTFVSTGWSGTPILVTLVSDPDAGLLALVAERSEVVTDDPDAPSAREDGSAPSNMLEKKEDIGADVNAGNSL